MSEFSKEVYIAYGLDKEVLYVGQGNIGRNNHCTSGASHNKHLNRYYFLNGEGNCIKTEVYKYVKCEVEAVELEKFLISKLFPKYNTIKQPKSEAVISSNFKSISEKYYFTYNDKLFTGEYGREEELEQLKGLNKDFGKMVDVIGIEEIKKTGFHKTKSKVKYDKATGITDAIKGNGLSYKNLNIRKGEFVSYCNLKNKIQDYFDKNNIKATAKATDIKIVYNVKRTARGGVEGYLIGDKR